MTTERNKTAEHVFVSPWSYCIEGRAVSGRESWTCLC